MSDSVLKVSMNDLAPIIVAKIQEGNSIEIAVTGFSMFPLFFNGRDRVTLSPIKKLKRKQICFYKRENGVYVLHRIVKIKKDGIYCAGDHQTFIEGPLNPNCFIAVVTKFNRKGKISTVKALWYKLYSFIWCISVKKRRGLYKFLAFITGRKVNE